MRMLGRLVSVVTTAVVGIVVVGIALVLLEANKGNEVVEAVLDAGRWLVQPFDNLFKLDSTKARVGVNWGIAAVIYSVAGGLIARLLSRR